MKCSCNYLLYILYPVSPGYVITFNATEYEFDINVYSPNRTTVVFEALLITENLNELNTLTANFRGSREEYGRYSLNGMDETVVISSFPSNPLLTIALDESLENDDDEITYNFGIDVAAFTSSGFEELSANVILHEIGKILDSYVLL